MSLSIRGGLFGALVSKLGSTRSCLVVAIALLADRHFLHPIVTSGAQIEVIGGKAR